MAGVESAKKALWALLRNFNASRTAKLTVTTAKGKLKVILEESFDQHSNVKSTPKRPSPSQLRRKEKRAADPAVRQRAAEHQARVEAASSEMGSALPSPEKERSSCCLSSPMVSPIKEVAREEVSEIIEEEVGKLPRLQVPHDFEDRANNDYFHDFEKVKEAQKIMSEADQCGFCDFKCSTPTLKESGDRWEGMLQSLWDHIEHSHPLAYEWLG